MIAYLLGGALAVVLLAAPWVLARQDRHIDHLVAELRHAGGRDQWAVRCAHCQRPLRDAATIAHAVTHQLPGGGTRTTTRMWHDGKPACAAAADADTPVEATP